MRISEYQSDSRVTVGDRLIGSDGDKNNKTKNFPIGRVSDYILAQLRNSGVMFRFSDGTNPDLAIGEPGYFFSEGNITDKTLVTTLYFSTDSYYGEQLSELFASVGSNLGDLYLGLTQQDDTANYVFFNVADVVAEEGYYRIDVELRGQLYAKPLVDDRNYSLYFDLASSNEYEVRIEAGFINTYKNGALTHSADLSIYLDDTNLARIIDGTVDQNGIVTFVRDDNSEFTVDFSTFLGQAIPIKTSDLQNDGDGVTPFATTGNTYTRTEVDNKDTVIQQQVTKLNGLYLDKVVAEKKIYLKNSEGTILSSFTYENDGAGYSIEFDSTSRTIYILDADNNITDSIPISILVEDKMDKGGYSGSGQDLKNYIDTLLSGLKWKDSVYAATTGNIVLSGEQIIDGQQTAASRILVKDQTDQTENGIYISDAGAWVRSIDADTGEELLAATTGVERGEVNAGIKFTQTSVDVVIGTTNIVWTFLSDALGITRAEVESLLDDKEDYLGVPDEDGKILSSTVSGVRTWITPTSDDPTVDHEYLTISAMIAAQNEQLEDDVIKVIDASEDTRIESGKAYYFYNGTTAETIDDYHLLSNAEVAELTSQAIIDALNYTPANEAEVILGVKKADGTLLTPDVDRVVTLPEIIADVHQVEVDTIWNTGNSQTFTVADSAKVTNVHVNGKEYRESIEWERFSATEIKILVPINDGNWVKIESAATQASANVLWEQRITDLETSLGDIDAALDTINGTVV